MFAFVFFSCHLYIYKITHEISKSVCISIDEIFFRKRTILLPNLLYTIYCKDKKVFFQR